MFAKKCDETVLKFILTNVYHWHRKVTINGKCYCSTCLLTHLWLVCLSDETKNVLDQFKSL